MAVVGIKNFDQIEKKLKKLGAEMGKEALADAMEAAGDVYRRALEAATPTGPIQHGKWAHKTHAKGQVIVYTPTRLRSLTEMRRLIGWTKDAFYMFFVDQGWRWHSARRVNVRGVKGGFARRLRRKGTDSGYYSKTTHGQSGVSWGGKFVKARKILKDVFESSSSAAGEAAMKVLKSWFERKAA
jgi:hypothetical protein